jgi:hypothetical protein
VRRHVLSQYAGGRCEYGANKIVGKDAVQTRQNVVNLMQRESIAGVIEIVSCFGPIDMLLVVVVSPLDGIHNLA